MRLASIEVIPYWLPFAEPYVTARGRLERRAMVLLRIRDQEGVEGLGEAVPLSLRGGRRLGQVAKELEEWGEQAIAGGGDRARLSPAARCAVETALLDLGARAAEVPVWMELGADGAEPVPCNATLTAGPPTAVAAQAETWAGEGFETFKLKVGVPGDVEQVEAVRAAVREEARVRVDANGAWTIDEAVRKLRAMRGSGLELAEEPVHGLEALAKVRADSGVPISADESLSGPGEAGEAAASGACDLATAKLSKVGGPAAALEVGARIPVYLSSALDGPVGIAAAGHTAQALRESGGDAGVAHGLATQRLFSETIAAVGCELRDGTLHLPDGPGLGVVLDDEALERHRLR
jgi:L-Ala-D/L-Glu epimerase